MKLIFYIIIAILLGILALWFGVSIPLALFGSYLGFKKPVIFFFLIFLVIILVINDSLK